MKVKTDKSYTDITANKEYTVEFLGSGGTYGVITTDSGVVMNVFLKMGCPLINMNRWEIIKDEN